MAFSSVPPVFLDSPNWNHHHQLQQQEERISSGNAELRPPGKPGSMSERARVAKIPQPETALKCPRCESTNTKFCYFNNYNLSQPRHFCKTCRRYWTRGGALRNVPVGGGCRRNKKISKKTTSPGSKLSRGAAAGNDDEKHVIMSSGQHSFPQSPFLSSFQNLRGIQTQMGTGSTHNDSVLSADWSLQNFPFLASGFHQAPTGSINSNPMFTFQSEAMTRSRVSGGDAAKVEERQLGLSSPATSFLGISANSNQHYYNPNSWVGGGHGNMWSGNTADHLPGQQLNSSASGDGTAHFL